MKYRLFESNGKDNWPDYFGIKLTIDNTTEKCYHMQIKEWSKTRGLYFIDEYFYFDSNAERVEFILIWL